MKLFRKAFSVILLVAMLVLLTIPVFAGTTESSAGQQTTATDITSTIINVLIIPLLPIVSTFIIALIKKKTEEAEQSINDNEIKRYINIADDAVCTAVAAVSQTYVDTLKKSQSFDSEAMKTAFITAKDKALKIMGTEAQDVLKYLYGDINTWLENKIEYYVNKSKA